MTPKSAALAAAAGVFVACAFGAAVGFGLRSLTCTWLLLVGMSLFERVDW